jgi:hypothetical protein
MNPLFEALGTPHSRAVGLVVVIGAGDGRSLNLARLAEWAPRRLVLVEGDPDAVADLERLAPDPAWVTVRPTTVAPQAGRLRWLRHNLPAFNGPLSFDALRPYYPRLRVVEERRQHATALADLLASLAQGLKAEEHNVLVLDLPGQEDALLATLQPQRLQDFSTLVVRGCREALPPDGVAADAVAARLLKLHFAKARVDDQSEPLWPVTTFVLDAERVRADQRSREQAQARAVQQRAAARLAELEAEQARWQGRAEAAEARLAEVQAQLQVLTQGQDALATRLAESEAARQHLAQAHLHSEQAHQAAQTLVAQQAQQLQGLQDELSTLQGQHVAAQATHAGEMQNYQRKHHDRVAQLDQQARAAVEARNGFEAQLADCKAQLAAAAAAGEAAANRAQQQDRRWSVLSQAHDTLERTAASHQARAHQAEEARALWEQRCADARLLLDAARERETQLAEQMRTLEAAQSVQQARHQALQDELHRAEGQIELIKDLLLGESGL